MVPLETAVDIVSGKKYSFRYSLSSNQAIDTSNEVVTFNKKDYGDGVVDGVYTCPVNGWYQFEFSILINSYGNMQIRKNGSLSKLNIILNIY